MTPKRFLIMAVMFLLVTGSLLPELAADHSSENEEAENNIAVGMFLSVWLNCLYLLTADYL